MRSLQERAHLRTQGQCMTECIAAAHRLLITFISLTKEDGASPYQAGHLVKPRGTESENILFEQNCTHNLRSQKGITLVGI